MNSRKFEDYIWADSEVLRILREDVVIATLFVDDKTLLEKPLISSYNGKELKTVGDKWADFQVEKFEKLSQPQHILVDHNGTPLNGDATYMSHGSVKDFADWLKVGLSKFH